MRPSDTIPHGSSQGGSYPRPSGCPLFQHYFAAQAGCQVAGLSLPPVLLKKTPLDPIREKAIVRV
ncbi:hypothetical protein [Aeromonas sp. 5HA1]|uniref:hypothetical protein n=1 Tax=Aeromonas sp. 5HA1 TaxID=2699197 RepID=UPI0023DD69B2|nr:hypothetical protein [Aeromonas sp. 5HA1]MDF2401994.1 hypothetical protein [Aeromonas sp. 5HA1]